MANTPLHFMLISQDDVNLWYENITKTGNLWYHPYFKKSFSRYSL